MKCISLICGLILAGHQVLAVTAEVSLRGAGVALRGDQPNVVILDDTNAPPVTLMPQGEAAVTNFTRQTPGGAATAQTLTWNDARGFKLSWTQSRLEQLPGVTVQMTFENRSAKPVRLREFGLLQSSPTEFTVTGAPQDWWLSTLDSHDSAVGGFHPSGDLTKENDRKFLDTMTLYTELGKTGVFMGAVGPAVSDVYFRCRVTKTGVGLVIASEMNDIIVDPGETRCSEEVLLLAAPFDSAAPVLFRWLAATHGSRTARGPIDGWCSWYSKGKNITGSYMDELCAKVKADRDRLPLQVIQVDDGWQKAYGDWEVDRAKFPAGMKAVADQIRAAGAIPGIWLCPNRTSKDGQHPDGLANDYLDCSHPAVQAFIRKILTDRVADGYRYFKLDFLWIRFLTTRYNQKKTRLEICRDVNKLYRESIGEDAYLLSCVGGLNRGCFGYADAARIGTDTSGSLKKLYVGCSMADCINATGSTAWSNGILFANDPDVTYLKVAKSGTGRTWHAYVGLLGGLMVTSESLPNLDPAALRNLEILMPPAPDKGRAFDGQTDPWHRRFGFVAQRSWGNFASILLWNPDDKPADITLAGVPVQSLGKKFHVWSFWDEKYLGIADETFVANALPAHSPVVLRLTAVDAARPVVIGSTLHIAMGSAEFKDVQTTATGMTISLTDAGARDGKLVVYSRQPLRLDKADGCQATLATAAENLWTVTIRQRQRGVPNMIRLSPTTGTR